MGKVWSLKDAHLMVDEMGKETREAASAGLLAAAHRAVAYIVADVIPNTVPPPVDRGIYRAGWRAKKFGTGAVVENVSPNAPFIEDGVRGSNVKIGRKMIAALAEWVRRKGIGGKTVTGRTGKSRFVKASKVEATQIAWAIARSLQKQGIFNKGKGLGVLKKASKKFPQFIDEEVSKALRKS